MKRLPKSLLPTPKPFPPPSEDSSTHSRQIYSVLTRTGSLQQIPRSGYLPQRNYEEKPRPLPSRGLLTGKETLHSNLAIVRDLPKGKIPRPVLVPVASQPALQDSANVAPPLIRYQFQTPPRVRSNAATPQSDVTLPRLQQKLPKLELNETQSATHKSDSCPNTARATPDTAGRTHVKNQPSARDGQTLGQITSLGYRTRTGMTGGKRKRFNQDTHCVALSFAGQQDQTLLCVFDGHGLYGHEVSGFLKRSIPRELATVLQRELRGKGKAAEEEEKRALRAAVYEGMLKSVESLLEHQKVDITFSGSTAVTVLLKGSNLVCGNIGDSRAVLGQQTSGGWTAFPLSHDHKPDSPTEKKRIEESGGRVQPYLSEVYSDADGDFVGPARVWIKGENIPGLAMSRSVGDLVASQVGVTSQPEIITRDLEANDKFLILASDGLWEFLPSQTVQSTQCVEVVAAHWPERNVEAACDRLMHEAVMRWRKANGKIEEVIDDITFVIVFFA